MEKVIVIPARLASTRLENKLLLDLGGKSVIQRVYEQCVKAKGFKAVYIAVDHQILQDHCLQFTDNVIMTDPNHQSGTDRIAEATLKIDTDILINVQGDEPFINPELIEALGETFSDQSVTMSSAMHLMDQVAEIEDVNNVKVVTSNKNDALYFSRLPIPYLRDQQIEPSTHKYYKHIGIYGYTKNFLLAYAEMPPSILEASEKLEQLRVLENGFSIRMIETNYKSSGIDTKEDYIRAKQLIS